MIEFQAYSGCRPVNDAADLCVGDAFEVTQHQHRTSESRQPVVGGEDGTELFGHPLNALADSWLRRLRGLQEGTHGEFAQVGRRFDQRRPALARGNQHNSGQIGRICAHRRTPSEQVRQLVGVHPPRLGALF